MPSFHDAATPEDVPGGEIERILSVQEESDADLIEVAVELLNRAVTIRSNGIVKMTECHMCGGWEGTHVDCPVPALERWLETHSN
jgi:hypothetical protein